MRILGLTGSIGMGKTAAAAMFRELGVPVHSADDAVHRLYEAGGAGARAIAGIAPRALREDGSVDRERLRGLVRDDPGLLAAIEALVHPLVEADRESFLARARAAGESLAVLDSPLLYETGGDAGVDAVVVVSAPESEQRRRVLERPGMTPEALAAILRRQTPDAEKRARADYVVDSGRGFDYARKQVAAIAKDARGRA